MSAIPRHRAAGSCRAQLALLLALAQVCSGPAAYALKAPAPGEGTVAGGLEEQLRGGAGAREHYIHTLERVVVGDRLAMTVIPNQDALASRVVIAEPDGETTFMTWAQAANPGIARLRFVDLATGQSQPIHAQGVDNPRALTYHAGIVYIAQSEGRLHRFDVARQEWLPTWTLIYTVVDGRTTNKEKSRAVRLAQPGGVAVDGPRGILYVTESEAGRILGFRLSDGTFSGFLVGGLSAPEDVVVGPHPTDAAKSALYVADRLQGRVLAYEVNTGAPLAFSIPDLTNPAKLAIDPEHRLLFVVSDHAGFLGGFRLDTGEKIALAVSKTPAVRAYYEEHAAEIEVDLQNAVDVVYDPQTKAMILATHQRLIPFWVEGQRLRLTPPAAGLEEITQISAKIRRAAAVPATALQIWLVDDNPMDLGVSAEVLGRTIAALPQGQGFDPDRQIRRFSDPEQLIQALTAAGSAMPDVVVTDFNMPSRDGLAVADAVREHAPATRVVLLSIPRDGAQERMFADAVADGRITAFVQNTGDTNTLAAAFTPLLADLLAPAGLEEGPDGQRIVAHLRAWADQADPAANRVVVLSQALTQRHETELIILGELVEGDGAVSQRIRDRLLAPHFVLITRAPIAGLRTMKNSWVVTGALKNRQVVYHSVSDDVESVAPGELTASRVVTDRDRLPVVRSPDLMSQDLNPSERLEELTALLYDVWKAAAGPEGENAEARAAASDIAHALTHLAGGLEEPTPEERQAQAVTALETLQRAARVQWLTAPTDRCYFLKDDAVLLAPAFERLGLRFLVRVETSRAAKALMRLGVPTDRIAGAISAEQTREDYQRQGVARVATAAWGDRRFLETAAPRLDSWTFANVRTVQRIPDSDPAWVFFWNDWPVPYAVREQLIPAVQATEAYFQAMG